VDGPGVDAASAARALGNGRVFLESIQEGEEDDQKTNVRRKRKEENRRRKKMGENPKNK